MVSAASAGQVVNNNIYDVWWVHSGANRICLAMSASTGGGGGWSSDTAGSNTARGTGYSQLDFVTRPYITNKNALTNCFNAATNYGSVSANQATYLGSIYSTANGQTGFIFGSANSGTAQQGLLGVFNAYNQRTFNTALNDTTASWTYTTATFRQANGSTGNQITVLDGLGWMFIRAQYSVNESTGTGSPGATIGVGLDSTTAIVGRQGFVNLSTLADGNSSYSGKLGIGLHVISANEKGNGTNTTQFFGSNNMQLEASLHGM